MGAAPNVVELFTVQLRTNIRPYIYYCVFGLTLLASIFRIHQHFPEQNDYYVGADEGVYFRHASFIKDNGLTGFRLLARDFLAAESIQPPPLRVAHTVLASIALRVDESMRSLSYLALLFFGLWVATCFLWVRKHWDLRVALLTGVLLSFSPLAGGLAKRALMDTEHAFFLTLTLFACFNFIEKASRANLVLLVACLSASIATKEPTLLFVPFFFGALLISKRIRNPKIQLAHAAIIAIVPVVLVAAFYALAFGGIGTVIEMYDALVQKNVLQTFPYKENFLSGPWYQYFVDYLILSPVVSVSFFMFLGYYWTGSSQRFEINVLQAFFGYAILGFAFLSKDVRYVMSLELVYRLFSALLLLHLAEQWITCAKIQKVVVASFIALFLALDISKFDRVFVENDVYDPISYNLLIADSFFTAPYQTRASQNALNRQARLVLESPTEQNYLQLSLYYYQNRLFERSIEAAEKAIGIRNDYAEAYNNICAAYNGLGEWDKAIEHCQKALALRPDFQLAQNNLAWAERER